MYLDLFGS